MKMKTETFNLESTHKDMVDYLARLSYECESRRNVISQLMERNPSDEKLLDGATFNKYHKQYEESLAAYDIAKNDFANMVLPDKYKNNPNARWELEFSSYELKITSPEK